MTGFVRPIVAGELQGRRLYLSGYRIHHGLVGLVLLAVGAALAFNDRHDWPFRLVERR